MPCRQETARCAALVVAMVISLGVRGAVAQSPPERNRIASVSLGLQIINDAFHNRVTFRQYDETGFFDAHYDVTKHYALGGDIAFRVWKALGFGIAVSHVAEPTRAIIDAQVPNEFFFNFPRSVRGVRRNLKRRELGLHLQGQIWRLVGDDFLLRVTWGPTIFIARQDLVSGIITRESTIDIDQVSLVNHQHSTVTAGSLGLNLGIDGSLFMTERAGLGFTVRYSRGTATIRLGNRSPTPIELGGIHAGGGLRLAF